LIVLSFYLYLDKLFICRGATRYYIGSWLILQGARLVIDYIGCTTNEFLVDFFACW